MEEEGGEDYSMDKINFHILRQLHSQILEFSYGLKVLVVNSSEKSSDVKPSAPKMEEENVKPAKVPQIQQEHLSIIKEMPNTLTQIRDSIISALNK